MKKSINLLSLLTITTLLSCTGEVIKQNVSIDTKPTPSITPTPSVSNKDKEIKNTEPSIKPSIQHSLIEPSAVNSLDLPIEKRYALYKIVTSQGFVLREERIFLSDKDITSNEFDSDYRVYKNSQGFLDYTKNFKSYYMNLDINEKEKIFSQIVYPDGKVQTISKFNNDIVATDGSILPKIIGSYEVDISPPEDILYKNFEGIFYEKLFNIGDSKPIYFKPLRNPLIINIYNKNEHCNKEKFNVYSTCFNTCITSDMMSLSSFNGKVVDLEGKTVIGAKVSAKAIDPGVTWTPEEKEITNDCNYEFIKAPVGPRIHITVTKEGWTTRQQTVVLKGNLNKDPFANNFNFEGIYALQDEPEITSLRVNTKGATGTGSTSLANLSGLDNGNLEIEMTFSEPVRTDDIQNNFRVRNITNNFVIDNNTYGITWTWSNNDRNVKFMTNQAILANKTGEEAKYIVEFIKPFRDKNENYAKAGKYFRFNPANSGNFNVFSVKNDETAPKLLSLTVTDGGSSNDVIELKFSEAMDIIGRKADELELNDPLAPSNKTRSLRAYQTNNNGNNATILGFSIVDNSFNINDFRGVFTIGRLTQPISSKQALLPLNINNLNSGSLIDGKNIISSRIRGSYVTLEFPPTAFNKDDLIILSVGRSIIANYQDKNNVIPSFSLDVASPNITNALITDPAGILISNDNESFSANVTVNNSQRVGNTY